MSSRLQAWAAVVGCVVLVAAAVGLVFVVVSNMGSGSPVGAPAASSSPSPTRTVVGEVSKSVRLGKAEVVRVNFTAEAGQRLEITLSSTDEDVPRSPGDPDWYAVTWLSDGGTTGVDMVQLPRVTAGAPAVLDVPVLRGGGQQVWVTVLDEGFRGQLTVTATTYVDGG